MGRRRPLPALRVGGDDGRQLQPVDRLDQRRVEHLAGHAVADERDPDGSQRAVAPRRATASMVTAASRTMAVTTYFDAAL